MDKENISISSSILIGSVIIALSVFISNSDINFGDSAKVFKKAGGVEVVEYSDFQCPFCKRFHDETFAELKKNYIDTGKITFVYKHFPLSNHQNAQKSAEASECARDQGKFEEYHDILFQNSESDGAGLNDFDLKKYAKDLGLDTTKFNSCLSGGEKTGIVEKDMQEGLDLGVSATPTFFINGRQFLGAQPYSKFKEAIESAILVHN